MSHDWIENTQAGTVFELGDLAENEIDQIQKIVDDAGSWPFQYRLLQGLGAEITFDRSK
jgi:hypothetical protein